MEIYSSRIKGFSTSIVSQKSSDKYYLHYCTVTIILYYILSTCNYNKISMIQK